MNLRLLLLALLVGTASSSNAQTMALVDRQALLELEALAAAHPDTKDLLEVSQAYPVAEVNGQPMGFIGQLAEGISETEWLSWCDERSELEAGAVRGGIASFRVHAQALDVLNSLPMDLVELASRAVPDVNKARYGTRVDSVHAGFNLPQPYHGEGVLIGVLDWGFDYTHPMFFDTTLTETRIERFGTNTAKRDPPRSPSATERPWKRPLSLPSWAATPPMSMATPPTAPT